jgi:hypothetical protein
MCNPSYGVSAYGEEVGERVERERILKSPQKRIVVDTVARQR